jgi:hypothetical protein
MALVSTAYNLTRQENPVGQRAGPDSAQPMDG